MVYWLVVRSEQTGEVLESHAYADFKTAKRNSILIEEGYQQRVTVNIEVLQVAEMPKAKKPGMG